jgi:hypothetical protein
MAIRARFKGEPHPLTGEPAQYLDGIPARNLSDEEYDALPTEDKARLRGSDLYDVAPLQSRADKPTDTPPPAEATSATKETD